MNELKNEEINDVKKGRRRALAAITAGGAVAAVMPATWVKPAMKSLVIPAHAQTSGVDTGGSGTSSVNSNCAITGAFAYSSVSSFSMSFLARTASSCGAGTAVLQLFNSDGEQFGSSCTVTTSGGTFASFSCSASYYEGMTSDVAVPAPGDTITIVADFQNGCSCVAETVAG